MSDAKLIEKCKALAPDADIVAAGAFQPRGTQGAALLGPLGAFAGRYLAQAENVPRYAVVAVTADEVLLFRAESFSVGWQPAELVTRYPRDTTVITRENGILVRKLSLNLNGQRAALESPRVGPWHGAAVFAALAS
jgi:hypothetical protein